MWNVEIICDVYRRVEDVRVYSVSYFKQIYCLFFTIFFFFFKHILSFGCGGTQISPFVGQ